MNDQIKKYIDEARSHNMPDSEIRLNLSQAGWTQQQIDDAFAAIQPPISGTQVETNPAHRGFTNRGMLWGGVLILILAIVLGGYYMLVYAKNSPEKVWNQMKLGSLDAVSSVHTEQAVEISAQEKNGSPFNAKLTTSSDTDAGDKTSVKAKTKMSLSFSYQGGSMTIDNVEARLVGSALYINISNIPYIGSSAKDYDGWVKFDYKAASSGNNAPFDVTDLKNILNQNSLIKSHTYESKDTVNGEDTYKYKVEIDKGSLKNIINAAIDQLFAQNPNLKSSGTDINSLKSSVSDVVDHFDLSNTEIWISPKDKMLRKFALNADYSDPSKIPDLNGPLHIGYTAIYSSYGEKISVDAPVKSLDIQNALNQALQQVQQPTNVPVGNLSNQGSTTK